MSTSDSLSLLLLLPGQVVAEGGQDRTGKLA